MSKRYFTATLLAMIAASIEAQTAKQLTPRLVVNIAIDQLTTDYIDQLTPYFGTDGFRKLMAEGIVYQNVSYPFTPVDRSSAIATIMTGTTPYYHGIIGNRWLNRTTIQPMGSTDDKEQVGTKTVDRPSPRNILTSTIGDELKVKTGGRAIVYGLSKNRDAAILSAGHAADGALWKDPYTGNWCSSTYYMKAAPEWLSTYNKSPERKKKKKTEFEEITELTNLAILCMEKTGMGTDDVPDMLNITLDASSVMDKKKKSTWQEEVTKTYINLDRQLADLIATIEHKAGPQNVVFFITSTGYVDEPTDDYDHFRVPTGTVYINRTANLLNLYLGALYGSDRYVDGCSRNQIYLNVKDIEQKRLKINEILSLSQSFLLQCEGIRNAYTIQSLQASQNSNTELIRNGMNVTVGGQIVLDIAPGWKLVNEENQDEYQVDSRAIHFPIIIYRQGAEPQQIVQPVTIDRLAPTIATTIHIRAPNACSAQPL